MKLNQEHLIGIVCVSVSALVLAVTPGFPKGQAAAGITGPAFFPNLLAVVFAAFGAYQILRGFSRGADYPPLDFTAVKASLFHARTRTAFIIVGLIAAYILLLDLIGFIPMTLLFLFVFMKRLGVSGPRTVLYSVVFTVSIYFLFGRLFTINLPAGLLGYLGM